MIFAALAIESYFLNFRPELSVLSHLKVKVPAFKDLNLSPAAGKPISWYLGWAGFLTMSLTNIYSFRKRLSFMKNMGELSGWLDFHILCGLVGPTFILFHTNFKVGGLVAISFWSMVISFASGIVGRYFYAQLLQHKSNLEKDVQHCEIFLKSQSTSRINPVPEHVIENLKVANLRYVGAGALVGGGSVSAMGAIFGTFAGDFKRRLLRAPTANGVPPSVITAIQSYALKMRRLGFLGHFQRLMGYWHSFHFPFAVFMYIVALIHIATALLFTTSMK